MNRLLEQGSIFEHLSKEELVNLLESEGLIVGAGHGEIMDADDNVIYSPRNNNLTKVEMEGLE